MKSEPSFPDVAFVVVSCDKYSDLWEPFFHCLRKYWPDCPYPVYLVSNHKDYEEHGVTTLKVGDDRSYSDNLRTAMAQLSQPWVILWLEDVFICERVDTARFTAVIERARSIPVGYLKLSPQLPLSYETTGEIGPIPKGVRYRSAIGVSLYDMKTLDKLLVPGASAWDLDTSNMSDTLDEPFYSLTSRAARRPLMKWVHGVIKGRWCFPAVGFLRREGFGHLIPGRERLDIRTDAYVGLFKIHNWLFRLLRKHWV